MNLYKLHKDPKSLDHHEDAHDAIVHLFWDKFKDNPAELKKREKAISQSAKYSWWYAEKIHGRFKLGEPAIAKDPHFSYSYARHILEAPFELGEPSIATDGVTAYLYATNILGCRFKLGEKSIQEGPYWNRYKEQFLS